MDAQALKRAAQCLHIAEPVRSAAACTDLASVGDQTRAVSSVMRMRSEAVRLDPSVVIICNSAVAGQARAWEKSIEGASGLLGGEESGTVPRHVSLVSVGTAAGVDVALCHLQEGLARGDKKSAGEGDVLVLDSSWQVRACPEVLLAAGLYLHRATRALVIVIETDADCAERRPSCMQKALAEQMPGLFVVAATQYKAACALALVGDCPSRACRPATIEEICELEAERGALLLGEWMHNARAAPVPALVCAPPTPAASPVQEDIARRVADVIAGRGSSERGASLHAATSAASPVLVRSRAHAEREGASATDRLPYVVLVWARECVSAHLAWISDMVERHRKSRLRAHFNPGRSHPAVNAQVPGGRIVVVAPTPSAAWEASLDCPAILGHDMLHMIMILSTSGQATRVPLCDAAATSETWAALWYYNKVYDCSAVGRKMPLPGLSNYKCPLSVLETAARQIASDGSLSVAEQAVQEGENAQDAGTVGVILPQESCAEQCAATLRHLAPLSRRTAAGARRGRATGDAQTRLRQQHSLRSVLEEASEHRRAGGRGSEWLKEHLRCVGLTQRTMRHPVDMTAEELRQLERHVRSSAAAPVTPTVVIQALPMNVPSGWRNDKESRGAAHQPVTGFDGGSALCVDVIAAMLASAVPSSLEAGGRCSSRRLHVLIANGNYLEGCPTGFEPWLDVHRVPETLLADQIVRCRTGQCPHQSR